MSLEKNVNGLHQFILNRDEFLFDAIAIEFKLDVAAVRAAAYSAEDNWKPKPIKPQARKPKKEASGAKPAPRKKSGFLAFTKSKREEAKTLLINNPKERKIKLKNGDIEEIIFQGKNVGEDGVVKPGFTEVNKKCTAMWWALSDEERAQWVERARNVEPEISVETELTENSETGEDTDVTEESEKKVTPEKSKIPPKKGKGEGRNPVPKAQVPAKKQQAPAKATPAPKNSKTTARPNTKPAPTNNKKPQNKKVSQSSEAESSDQ
jgi:hypothetical protein